MSIRLRLTLWYVSLLAVILVVISGVLYAVLSYSFLSETDRTLQTRAAEVQHGADAALEVQSDPRIYIARGRFILPAAETFATPGVFVQVSTPDGVAVSRSENLGAQTLVASATTLAAVANGDALFVTLIKDNVPLRMYVAPLNAHAQIVGVIQVAESLQGVNTTLAQLATWLIIGIAAGLALAFGVGTLLAGSALAPMDRITSTAHAIARSNDLSRRIEQNPTKDEVGRLAETFNEMLARIEELFRAQQRFVADVSHELRSPLTAIRGNLDLLRRGAVNDALARQEALAAIESEAARMQRLVADLLLLARADAGVTIEKQIVELDTLLLDIYRQARLMTTTVKVSLGSEDQAQVVGDPDRLKQLFLNLADNAIKYTPAGGTVTLALERDEALVRVTIADTGVGIPASDLPKIFDRFYRADKSRVRDPANGAGGTGLGLAIVKWIVDAHGGTITVASQVGKGSMFTVTLPLAPTAK